MPESVITVFFYFVSFFVMCGWFPSVFEYVFFPLFFPFLCLRLSSLIAPLASFMQSFLCSLALSAFFLLFDTEGKDLEGCDD